jgi:alanine-glyoxylate transaminase/serine-glyoxylate transaminase/serine-pyruvate transaminase
MLEARHWGIIDGKDVAAGRLSPHAFGLCRRRLPRGAAHHAAAWPRPEGADYAFHEAALREAVSGDGLHGHVQHDEPGRAEPAVVAWQVARRNWCRTCRAKGFGIWPTLSEPVQVRIGILNQLSEAAITEIVTRFAAGMNAMGAGDRHDEGSARAVSISTPPRP